MAWAYTSFIVMGPNAHLMARLVGSMVVSVLLATSALADQDGTEDERTPDGESVEEASIQLTPLVVAQKREQASNDVPITIDVLDRDDLQRG